MSVLLPAPRTWQPESLSCTTSLSHPAPCSSQKFPADVCMGARAVRQPQGMAVTCRLPCPWLLLSPLLVSSGTHCHPPRQLQAWFVLEVKDQAPFQTLVLQALLDIITITSLIKLKYMPILGLAPDLLFMFLTSPNSVFGSVSKGTDGSK